MNDVKMHIMQERLSRPKDMVTPGFQPEPGIISKGSFSKKPKLVPSGFKKNKKQTAYMRLKIPKPFAYRLIFTVLFGKNGAKIISPANIGKSTNIKGDNMFDSKADKKLTAIL